MLVLCMYLTEVVSDVVLHLEERLFWSENLDGSCMGTNERVFQFTSFEYGNDALINF